MSKPNRHCILHPDRPAHVDATGILVCDECWQRYATERRYWNGKPIDRPFFQQLVNTYHNLGEANGTQESL